MEKYIDYSVEQITSLCRIPSPSGFTVQAQQYLLDEFAKLGFKTIQSRKGSVIVELGGEGNPLVLAAHIDTLGAMVRSIKGTGKLRVTQVGGYPFNYIETENCIIHTRKGKTYSGTFQLNNPSAHVNSDARTAKRTDENVEIVIDEKVKSKEDVQKLGIRAGDFVSFDSRTVVTESGFIKSRHLDDKASAGIFIGLAKWIRDEEIQLTRKVYLVFTNYEEVGHGGAAGIPDDAVEMISVDMGAVGDDLETDEYTVSICAKDSMSPYDYSVTNKLIELADREKLNYAIDIYPHYGSDVDVTLGSGRDILHGLIGPGVFASHGYERTHRDAVENTFKLLAAYVTA